ncbi:12-oxophytodienoate reductase [Microbacterium sp. NPDC028030]|uniref:oxidoreductase n=1 Tax=Microbacterium sp. NPDC028030 TaxID=3155124 RepID=UPI00340F86D2
MTIDLSTPFTVRNTVLANRVVLAPMGVGHCENGVPDDDLRAFYRRRAENGVGLLVTGATFIDHPSASNHVLLPTIAGHAAQAAWQRTVDDVHGAGAPILLQLVHAGVDRDPGMSLEPTARVLSPSGVDHEGRPLGETMNRSDIDEVIQAFARSATIAENLGFDGVEVHGAHGFLIDQFMWGRTNLRRDAYGEPSRFAVDIVRAIRATTGPDFIVSFRWSQWKMHDHAARIAETPRDLERFLRPISDAGVDLMHASTRRWWEPLFPGSRRTAAGWTRQLTGRPAIAVGSIGTDGPDFHSVFLGRGTQGASPSDAIAGLQSGEFDLLAVGRPLLGDPEWAAKILSERYRDIGDFDARALVELY